MATRFIQSLMNTRADESTIIANAKFIDRCQFGTSVIAISSIRMQKQKTNEALFESIFGFPFSKVQKVSFIQNFKRFIYEKKVDAISGNPEPFKPEKQSGASESDIARCIKVTDRDGSYMLQCNYQTKNNTRTQVRYVVDGKRFATQEEESFIKANLYVYEGSKKQEEHGVKKGEDVRFMQFKFYNIIAIGKNQVIDPIWEKFIG